MKRRTFMSAAAGSTTGFLSEVSQPHAQQPFRFDLHRDLIQVGMVGLGPYSHAMMYTEPLNHLDYPPRTNMRVTALWGKEDGYRSSYAGTDEQIEQKVRNLVSYMSIDKFTKELGVEHVVRHPEDMLGKVDAVFITDPEDSLNLARPFIDPPGHVTVAHYEYAKTGTGREPVLGTVTNSYEKPYRCWAKIVFRDDLWFKGKGYVVAEPAVYWEHQVGRRFHDEHISLPLLRIIDHTFMTGEWPESEEHILNKVAAMLMTHKSLVDGGQPVTREEIMNHSLPRKR